MKIFTESAERDGITIRSMASFAMTDNPEEDLSAQMQALKRSKTNSEFSVPLSTGYEGWLT